MTKASGKVSIAVTAAALLLLTAAATVAWPQPPEQPTAQAPVPAPPALGEEGPLVAEGQPADLAVIYTGGVVGYVEPCG